MFRPISLFAAATLVASLLCAKEGIALKPLFPDHPFTKPVAMIEHPEEAERWYIVEQEGRIIEARKGKTGWGFKTFADLREKIESGPSEAGLLGMAFHPRFKTNPYLFLSYTRKGGGLLSGKALVSVVSRFLITVDNRLDPGSETLLLALNQPYSNHNGGHILFGPDGLLYIGFGDGGWAGDPHEHAQNTNTWLGTILRIDPDTQIPYGIPPDNPFAQGGGRPEIYAWGLRNPWRFSFDSQNGTLWAGDVGQDRIEEIDRIKKGKNYGWDRKEGSRCYEQEPCDDPRLTDPVAEYDHTSGCSVTGGYVYRGKSLPFLKGMYLYGDFCTGTIWMLDTATLRAPQLLLKSEKSISSFATDRTGELYLIDYESGQIFRLVSAP